MLDLVWLILVLGCRWGEEDDQSGVVARLRGAAGDASAGGESRGLLSAGAQRAGESEGCLRWRNLWIEGFFFFFSLCGFEQVFILGDD